MKIENLHITDIKTRFAAITCKQDLIELINYVNGLLYGKDYIPLTEKGLNYYANPKFSQKRYTSFPVKKKNGGFRTINAPVNGLKHILRPLNLILNCVAEPHFKATGFVPGKSIVDNAKQHIGNHYVYNIDLKDFFHSFDRNRVKIGFMYAPFNLLEDLEPIAFMLASLCTHPFEVNGEIKTVLPQGAPTSPTITNILCVKLDRRLNGLAKRFNITYSRYADDITFSSPTNIFIKEEFLNELNRIILDQKLEINPSKTRLQQTGYRQQVTGLVVNKKVNVNSRYIKQLRNWLYLWERYGYVQAEQKFKLDYKADKGHVKKGEPNLENVLSGKLEYLKMVKGGGDNTYKKLKTRFETLKNKDSEIEKVFNLWENEGIKKAILLYQLKEKYDGALSHLKILLALNQINKQPMNKFEFIKEVLETKKFNSNQKERFIRLVSSEFANLEAKDSEILADIKAIKKKIGLSEAPAIVVGEEKNVGIKNEKELKAALFQLNLNYLEPVDKSTDPRNRSLNDKIDIISKVNYKSSNDKISFLQRVKETHGSLDSENALRAIKTWYFIVIQIEVMNGDYESIGISKDTTVMPPEVSKFMIERFNETLKKKEDKKDEKDLKEILLRFNLEYLDRINRDIDPRNTTLAERIDVLCKVTDKSYKDREPLLEVLKEKHEDLGSKKALEAINRFYFTVKQIEVTNGDYEHIGISKDTNIIPKEIIKQIIERSKKGIKTKKEDVVEPIMDDEKPNELPKYYYPSSLYKFLFNYNQNRILKSTCHDIGSQELISIQNYCETEVYDFNKHLEKIKEAYDSHEKKHFAPSYLKTRFRVYLTGKNYYGKPSHGWSEDSIKVNWSSSALRIWSKENPGVPPNLNEALIEHLENTGFENFESFTSNISGVPVQSFTELVYHFKNSFHIRGDNSLRDIIERINVSNNWNERIEFIIKNDLFPMNIEHFTDVDKLIQAYKSVIELIIEVTSKYNLEKPKVKLTAKVNLDEFQLSIHHLNSLYKKAISNTLERTGQQYRNLIENQINGLCNLILKAEFESGQKAVINIWNGKERSALSISDDNFTGVEHIFQFPKK
jgi:hypothetical protein